MCVDNQWEDNSCYQWGNAFSHVTCFHRCVGMFVRRVTTCYNDLTNRQNSGQMKGRGGLIAVTWTGYTSMISLFIYLFFCLGHRCWDCDKSVLQKLPYERQSLSRNQHNIFSANFLFKITPWWVSVTFSGTAASPEHCSPFSRPKALHKRFVLFLTFLSVLVFFGMYRRSFVSPTNTIGVYSSIEPRI